MKTIIAICLSLFVVCCLTTPLDDYVNTPDPTYSFTLKSQWKGLGYTAYAIDLISQTWLTPADSDTSVWQHWLTICVPDQLNGFPTSALYINGGGKTPNPPTSLDPLVETLCISSGTVVGNLDQIPPEPIVFAGDSTHKRRSEDAIIAYTWSHFLNNTNEPNWLLRLPMTKAVVRAMDTIQKFTNNMPQVTKITGFVIAGASKRGWTTWTTAAVDPRIVAMVPIVMPIVHMVTTINEMYQVYGGWSFALDDYIEMHILNYLNKPVFQQMAAVIDPGTYIQRYKMPKYVIASGGDEFFLPDSINFGWPDLIGPKFLRVVPDAEHSLAGQQLDIVLTVDTFYNIYLHNDPYPEISWQLFKSNTTAKIVATIPTQTNNPKLEGVYMWYAYTLSSTQRDFRLIKCTQIPQCLNPVLWYYDKLDSQGNGVYVATMNRPAWGWGAFLIEAVFSYNWPNDPLNPQRRFRVTTEVNVVPDILPFPPCGQNCQPPN